MKLTSSKGKTHEYIKAKYYQKSYLAFLEQHNCITLLDLVGDQIDQACDIAMASWVNSYDKAIHERKAMSLHEKINHKYSMPSIIKAKQLVNRFTNHRDDLLMNILENLQEYKIIDDLVYNVTYQGMDIEKSHPRLL